LQFSLQNSQRRAQFMGRICRKSVDLMESFFQALDHAVEVRRETLKLVTRAHNWQLLTQIPRGDLSCLLPNFIHRAQRPPHQHIPATDREGYDQRETQAKGQEQPAQNRLDLVIRRRNFNQKVCTVSRFIWQSMKKEFVAI